MGSKIGAKLCFDGLSDEISTCAGSAQVSSDDSSGDECVGGVDADRMEYGEALLRQLGGRRTQSQLKDLRKTAELECKDEVHGSTKAFVVIVKNKEAFDPKTKDYKAWLDTLNSELRT